MKKVDAATKGLKDAVVSLEGVKSRPGGGAKQPPAVMDQRNYFFVPHVLAVEAEREVEFLNSDRLLHNLHSAPKENNPFNRTQPRGRTIPITFTKPEIVRVDCEEEVGTVEESGLAEVVGHLFAELDTCEKLVADHARRERERQVGLIEEVLACGVALIAVELDQAGTRRANVPSNDSLRKLFPHCLHLSALLCPLSCRN